MRKFTFLSEAWISTAVTKGNSETSEAGIKSCTSKQRFFQFSRNLQK